MTLNDFTHDLIQYWSKSGENPKVVTSVAQTLKFVNEKHYQGIMSSLKKQYSPSKAIGVYEIQKILEAEGIGSRQRQEFKFLVDCECCGNSYQYHMGTVDSCGLCHFPYEWTNMVVGYRVGSGTVPKTIEDNYHRLIDLYRKNLKNQVGQ